ncbi:MAG: tetratricopeptide repeat protein [Pirellulales bacterium]
MLIGFVGPSASARAADDDQKPAAEKPAKAEAGEKEEKEKKSDKPADKNAGQSELDEALEARIDAQTLADLERIIRLCRNALDKGLDDENTKFAKKLLASTYYQRGEALAKQVLQPQGPNPMAARMRLGAVGDLSEALAADPEIPAAYVLIARLQILPGGDVKQARTMLERVLTLKDVEADTRADALVMRSAFQDKPEARLADLDEAAKLNPSDPQPLRLRAATKLSLNKPEEAVADFDAALKIEPNHAATHEARGLALAAQKKWDEAKKSLTKAADLVPRSPAAILQRARVNLLAGDSKAALADAEEALEITPDMPEALLMRSQARQLTGDKRGAMADVDLLLTRFPNATSVLRARVSYLVDDERTADALRDLEKLAKLEPNDPNIALQTAVLHQAEKNHDEAIATIGKVLKTDPANWRALRLRGDAYLSLGKQTEAIDDYKAALKIEPKESGLLNNLAWVLATSPNDKLRDAKRSKELAELACEVTDYKTPHILSTLGAAYAEAGDFDGARSGSLKPSNFPRKTANRRSISARNSPATRRRSRGASCKRRKMKRPIRRTTTRKNKTIERGV